MTSNNGQSNQFNQNHSDGRKTLDMLKTVTQQRRRPNDCTLEVPATYSQKALHFLQLFQPESAAYNIPFQYHFSENVDARALESALSILVQRHDILRTSFHLVGAHLFQRVQPHVTLAHEEIDARQWTQHNIDAHCQAWAAEPFDLGQAPLMRSRLLHREQRDVWFLCFHHIAFDHISIVAFAQELNQVYQRIQINPEAVSQTPLPISVVDYAVWQQEHQTPEKMADHIRYWQECVPDPTIVLDLPSDFPRSAVMKGEGAERWFEIDQRTSDLVRQTAQQFQVSRYLLTMTQCAVLLHRYSKVDQFLLGTPFANRSDQAELQQVFGCFMNTLPLPFDFSDRPSFSVLLQRTQSHFNQIFKRQETPFELLLEALQPPRDTSHHPLFQVAFMYQDPPMSIQLGHLHGENQRLHPRSSKFDLTFWLWDKPDSTAIAGSLEYSTELFSDASVSTMLDVFQRVMKVTCEQPELPVDRIPLVDPGIFSGLTGAEMVIQEQSLHGMIWQQVSRAHGIAIKADDTELRYPELWQQANQYAQALLATGVSSGDFIGLALPRNSRLLVAAVGILQAGCAYVPLDPDYPKDRIKYMIDHSKMTVIVTSESLVPSLTLSENAVRFLTDEQVQGSELSEPLAMPILVEPEQPAYVIYTSGSTGLPKGVVVPHRSVVNFLHSMAMKPGLTCHDHLLAVTTLSFDISVLELFLPLTVGGMVEIVPAAVAKDPAQLQQRLNQPSVSVMQATPATWRMLFSSGWQAHHKIKILVGGEALPEDLLGDLLQYGEQVWNMYGPTETTIWSTCFQIHDARAPVMIGAPIHNTQCYVVDEHLQPLPAGVPGELLIGGDGVALGYLHRPDLTAERFLPDHFRGYGQLYRTGDLVSRLVSGALKYHNRLDNQVKIRGFRIELGEIEQALTQIEALKAAAVVVQGHGLQKQLVAFYETSENTITVMKIRRHLQQHLPRHMVPELYMALDAWPLTPSGKVDRKALARHKVSSQAREARPLSTSSEQYYGKVWAQILGRPVSPDDNFFDLGGNSLASLGVIGAAKKDFGILIPANALVLNSLAQLASQYAIPEMNHQTDQEAVVQDVKAPDPGPDVKLAVRRPWWSKLFNR